MTPVEHLSTDANGEFEFKNAAPGEYWMVVVAGKKKYKLALTLDPSLRKGNEDCSDLIYEMREDELQLKRMIHLH